MISFSDFYNGLGLVNYPFRTFTAETEENLNDIFIIPSNYEVISGDYKSSNSFFIIGNRGTGKTALHKYITREPKKNELIINIDNFENVNLDNDLSGFYNLFISSIIGELLNSLVNDRSKLKNLSKSERVKLSFYVNNFLKAATEKNLNDKIVEIQNSKGKRFFNTLYNKIRGLLNYGSTIVINYIVVFFKLPTIDNNQIKEIFPE